MQIPGTYPKGAFTRLKKQLGPLQHSSIFSSQQEVIIEAFTGAQLVTYLISNLFAVQQVTDDDGILPYTTVEFVFHTSDPALADTPYAAHIIIDPLWAQGEVAVHTAEQINAWAAVQGVQNPNLRSLHAVAMVVNFAWVVIIRMPWGMLLYANKKQFLPAYTGAFNALQAYGYDHPFMAGIRGRNFHLLEIAPMTPYRYYYEYGDAPYYYYQIP